MNRVARFVVERPKVVIAALICVTIIFAIFLPHIRMKTDTKSMAPENDPVIKQLEEAVDEFGSQEIMMVVVKGNMFTPDTLAKIDRLTTEISKLHGVENVVSPLNVDLIRGDEAGITISPIAESVPSTLEEIAVFRERLENSPQGSSLVTGNGDAMAIIITMEPGLVATRRSEILAEQVESLANREKGLEEVYVVGEPYMAYWASKNMQGDLNLLFPLVLVVIIGALYISFHSIFDVGILILSVLMSIVWTIGLMAALGYDLTMVSIILPIILIAMGSAAGIHILSRVHEEIDRGGAPRKATLHVLTQLTNPILMTSLTTAVGFGSLVSSFIPPVKDFGIFAAVGIMLNMLISLTCVPACLILRFSRADAHGTSRAGGARVAPKTGLLQSVLNACARFMASRPWVMISGALVILIVFAIGIPRVYVETNIMQYFRKDSPVVKGTDIVENYFGGTSRLSVLVDTGKGNGVKDPAILNRMLELEESLNSIDKVSDATSVSDLICEVNRAFHGDKEEYYSIPGSPEAVAQELLLFTMQGGSGLDSMVNYDFSKALISARVANVPTSSLGAIIEAVEREAEREFRGTGIRTAVVGLPKVVLRLMERFMDSQIKSLVWSMLGVWVVVSIIMRSAFMGGLCLIPLVITVVINFGFMGYMGIPLDVVTMMISGICIGIGIDYSIHLISRYRQEARSGFDKKQVITLTVGSTGRGIFFNAATLIMGFGLLAFSSFHAISVFGGLVAGTMATSALGALLVLPSVLILLPEHQITGVRVKVAAQPTANSSLTQTGGKG